MFGEERGGKQYKREAGSNLRPGKLLPWGGEDLRPRVLSWDLSLSGNEAVPWLWEQVRQPLLVHRAWASEQGVLGAAGLASYSWSHCGPGLEC